jgi:hypothetical protein
MVWLRRPVPDRPLGEPTIQIFRRLEMSLGSRRCTLDGKNHACKVGNWTVYIPSLSLKVLHARNGTCECIHPTRPSDAMLAGGESPADSIYSAQDWARALSTSTERRAAEMFVASMRLAEAGLGPWPLGLAWIEAVDLNGEGRGPSSGLFIENVDKLPRKPPATDEQALAAGVMVDRSRSAIRQQRRGYIIDLCSVVGVVPIDAEDQVRTIEQKLVEARHG